MSVEVIDVSTIEVIELNIKQPDVIEILISGAKDSEDLYNISNLLNAHIEGSSTSFSQVYALINDITENIHNLRIDLNSVLEGKVIVQLLDGTQSNITITHDFAYDPVVIHKDSCGNSGFPAIQYPTPNTVVVSSVIPLLGQLTLK